jgi:hypothetical protein
MDLFERIEGILLHPSDEWPKIAAEGSVTLAPYFLYVSILASIGPVALMLKSMGASMFLAVFTYAFTFFEVFMLALTVDVMAPSFGGERNFTQSLKLIAYSFTALWVADAFQLFSQPIVGGVLALAAAIYGMYTFYLGVPVLKKCGPGKAIGFTMLIAICTLLLSVILEGFFLWVIGAVLGWGQ